jgi:dTDP-4-dehydrorhamnose 3,5-epimerase
MEGVLFKHRTKHCDDRGFFMEVLREGEGMLDHVAQASVSRSYPGVVKAFHAHEKQSDLWYFPVGNAQVVLHDLRPDSLTYRQTRVYYMGEESPSILRIPPGVAHGYRVLGNQALLIFYLTTHVYDAAHPDEIRIPYDDPEIGFNWETQFH